MDGRQRSTVDGDAGVEGDGSGRSVSTCCRSRMESGEEAEASLDESAWRRSGIDGGTERAAPEGERWTHCSRQGGPDPEILEAGEEGMCWAVERGVVGRRSRG